MKIKAVATRLAALLLAGILVLPCVGCAGENEPLDTTDTAADETVTEAETEYKPDIEVKNYDADFNVFVNCQDVDMLYREETSGDLLGAAIYERGVNLREHLGVQLVMHNIGDWIAYADDIIKTVQAGDDDYQLVASTHTYQGIAQLLTANALQDIGELESVNLKAPYWSTELMEALSINGQYLLGYSEFLINELHCLVFNKEMMETYNLEEPYGLVRSKEWTMDKLAQMASNVAVDDGDQKWTHKDTYGLTGWGWTYLVNFVTSSDMQIVKQDSDGYYKIAYDESSEKMINLIDRTVALYGEEYTYFWPSTGGTGINFMDGTSLFQFYNTKALPTLRDATFRFGVVPYPLFDEQQEDYKSLYWGGYMCVPGAIRNPEMVGDVLELLAYYSAPVTTAYYEDLLGAKLSEAPDDAEMLEIIWASQTSDLGLVLCNCAPEMDALVYLLPNMCENPRNQYSSYLKKYTRSAQRGLDKIFGQS